MDRTLHFHELGGHGIRRSTVYGQQVTNTISQKYNLKLINQQGILIVLMTWQNGCRLLAFGIFRSQSPFFCLDHFLFLLLYSFSFQSKYGWNRKSQKPPSPIYNAKQYTTLFGCLSMSISILFLIVRHDCLYRHSPRSFFF